MAGATRSWRERLSALTRGRRDEATSVEPESPAWPECTDTIGAAQDRTFVNIRGTIQQLALRPRAATPWLEAELSDGTGRVTLVWMGRGAIPGIEVGRTLRVRGRLSAADGVLRLYNPHYELL